MHEDTHSTHPLSCDTCLKRFRRKDSLLNHVSKMHSDRRTYSFCQECGDQFMEERSLRDHLRKFPDRHESTQCVLHLVHVALFTPRFGARTVCMWPPSKLCASQNFDPHPFHPCIAHEMRYAHVLELTFGSLCDTQSFRFVSWCCFVQSGARLKSPSSEHRLSMMIPYEQEHVRFVLEFHKRGYVPLLIERFRYLVFL